jgi:hypothetical protein
VSEGGLEHEFRCDFPGSGKSCNKSNTTEADAPGYSATCSLSGPLPGLYIAGCRCGPLLLRRWLQRAPVPGNWAAPAGPTAFRVELGYAQGAVLQESIFAEAGSRAQSRLSRRVTLSTSAHADERTLRARTPVRWSVYRNGRCDRQFCYAIRTFRNLRVPKRLDDVVITDRENGGSR